MHHNLENLEKEIRWLEKVIYYSHEFYQGAYFDTYKYPRLSLKVTLGKMQVTTREARFVDVVPIYKDKGQSRYDYLRDSPCVTFKGQDVELLESDGEWLKVVGAVAVENRITWNNYHRGTFWIERSYTNLPKEYHDKMTWEECNQVVHTWPEACQVLIRDFIRQKKPIEYWKKMYEEEDVFRVEPPFLDTKDSVYARFVYDNQLSFEDRFLLILSLVPHVKPKLLDKRVANWSKPAQKSIEYAMGGIPGKHYKGFLPTGLTYLFLLCRDHTDRRLKLLRYLKTQSVLIQNDIVIIHPHILGEPLLSGLLALQEEYIWMLTEAIPAKEDRIQLNTLAI